MNQKQPLRIMILTKSFHPKISPRAFRATELAMEFSKQGHEVKVYSTIEAACLPEPIERPCVEFAVLPFVLSEISIGEGFTSLRKIAKRSLKLFLEYPDIELMFRVKRALEREKEYDLLISIAVPHAIHWGVALARIDKSSVARTWIADCGDPFMGQENDTLAKPFYFSFLEKLFCRRATFIAVPTEGAISAYYPEFRAKIKVIPQGFRFNTDQDQYVVKNAVPTFAYAGSFIPGTRDLVPILEHLRSLEIPFRFYVWSSQCQSIKHYEERLEGRLILSPPIARAQLLEQLGTMDFLINLDNKGRRQVPSKIIDYSIAGRPILSVRSSEFNPEKFNSFLEGDYSERLIVENINQYRIEHVADKFLSLAGR